METTRTQRDMGLGVLTGESEILETAREVTRLVETHELDAGVIGGVAVVLHGHIRSTVDVDVYSADLDAIGDALRGDGYAIDASNKEFRKCGVPVHLVSKNQIVEAPQEYVRIDDIRTVSLPDLLSMKLRSGTNDPLRAQDLADAIGLIRKHKLTGSFAAKLSKDVRDAYRKFSRKISREDK